MRKLTMRQILPLASLVILSGCSQSGFSPDSQRLSSKVEESVTNVKTRIDKVSGVVSGFVGSHKELFELRHDIDEAADDGLITAQQRTDLKHSSDVIENEVAKLDNLSGNELNKHKQKIKRDITRLDGQLELFKGLSITDVDQRLSNLRSRIAQLEKTGSVTTDEKNEMQRSLDEIDKLQKNQLKDGTLSRSDRLELLEKIADVEEELRENSVADRSDDRWF